jgi:hypothetical protein
MIWIINNSLKICDNGWFIKEHYVGHCSLSTSWGMSDTYSIQKVPGSIPTVVTNNAKKVLV